MNKRITTLTTLTTGIALSLACSMPVQTIACEFHDSGGLQNYFGKFHLPSAGDKASDVSRIYGEPKRRLGGQESTTTWDYGDFLVFFKGEVVTYVAML